MSINAESLNEQIYGNSQAVLITVKNLKNPILELDGRITEMLQNKGSSPFATDLITVQSTLRSTSSFTKSPCRKILDNAQKGVFELKEQWAKCEYTPSILTVYDIVLKEIASNPYSQTSLQEISQIDPQVNTKSDWSQYTFQIILESRDTGTDETRILVSSPDFNPVFRNMCVVRNVERVRQAIVLGANVNGEYIDYPIRAAIPKSFDNLSAIEIEQIKVLINVLYEAGAKLNIQWGDRFTRTSLGLDLASMPLDLVQFLTERGLDVNGVVPILARNMKETYTATPLSSAVAAGYRKVDANLIKKVEELVQLLVFNGALKRPPGEINDKYEENLFKMSRTILVADAPIRRIESNGREIIHIKETKGKGQLSLILQQAFLYCKIFNACLDSKLLIPSPLPAITANLFNEYCQINPFPKEIYGIIAEHTGAWGIPRSYLRLYYSESNILRDIIKFYSKDGKLPAGNLSKDSNDPITIEELVEADLVDRDCVDYSG